MGSLRVTVPYGSTESIEYTLQNVDPEARDPLLPTVQSTIHSNDHSTVYRASLSNKSVVLKFALWKRWLPDLENEADAYQNALAKLQGTIIPRFYGYFKGTDADKLPIACIVLEDCGDRVETFFDLLPIDDRVDILTKLAAIHIHGYKPRDFAERNVVCRDGQYRLIDFHSLKPHKDCGWEGKWGAGERIPLPGDFYCEELRMWGEEMLIWRPRHPPAVKIAGRRYFEHDGYPPQEVIDALVPKYYPPHYMNRPFLLEWLREVRIARDAGQKSIADYLRMIPEFPYPSRGQVQQM